MKWIIWFLLFILNGQANLEAWESITDQFDGIGMVCELPKKFLHKRSVNLCVLVLDPVIAFGRVQLHDD